MSLFGDIGTMFGGGNNNSQFTAQSANIIPTINAGQLSTAYGQTQQGLQQQQGLIGALNAQNGIGNQNQVYGQLQGVANGTGPNPAQTMLNQATGQNVANQAALMAGQRGAASNVGLMARQIGQQGAATQQQAAGQGATMQANQSLNALGQMGGMANQQAQQQIGAVGNYNTMAQGQQGQLLGAAGQLNSANVSNQGNMNSVNGAMSQTNANNANKNIGSLAGGLATAGMAAATGFARGGVVDSENIPSHLKDLHAIYHGGRQALCMGGYAGGGMAPNPKIAAVASQNRFGANIMPDLQKYASDGAVETMVSPGEKYLRPDQVKQFARGDTGVVKKAEKIDGKAKVSGDSEKNDTVKKKLETGGVVVPRTSVQKDDGKSFVAALLNDHAEKQQKLGEDDFKNALKKSINSRGKK